MKGGRRDYNKGAAFRFQAQVHMTSKRFDFTVRISSQFSLEWETGTFPDFAKSRANTSGVKLTRRCTNFLCTNQTASTYPCATERGGGYAQYAAYATTCIFVSADGLCLAWMCGLERVLESLRKSTVASSSGYVITPTHIWETYYHIW